ncbi:hypothetical protein [Desulfosarcina sp.]
MNQKTIPCADDDQSSQYRGTGLDDCFKMPADMKLLEEAAAAAFEKQNR